MICEVQEDFISKEVSKVWERPLDKLPVGKDLPRLCRKFCINHCSPSDEGVSKNETEWWVGDLSEDSLGTIIHSLLRFLALEFNELEQLKDGFIKRKLGNSSDNNTRELEKIEQDFDQDGFIKLSVFNREVRTDSHESITSFLLELFGEQSAVVKVLKLCHQTVVLAVMYHLRLSMRFHNIDFKDVRGKWQVFINLLSRPGEADTSVSVVHRRTEQVYIKSTDEGDYGTKNTYQFEWELEVSFRSKELNRIDNVVVRLNQIEWNNDIPFPQDKKQKEENRLRNAFFNTPTEEQVEKMFGAFEEGSNHNHHWYMWPCSIL
eukprot:gb/GECH01012565.1/.p1 GENE.gb/GECH01012565.1/~~gb/GECH01012565.1/.p1  ORF type:complete len:319 (+),score=78.52 gb/GECH01012565.1/:1-957(+)